MAWAWSVVKTAAARPKVVEFAREMASDSVVNEAAAMTGPKI